MGILDRFKAGFEHKNDKPNEQTDGKNPKWKQKIRTIKDEHRESDNTLEKDFFDVYLQAKGTPLGNPMDAWNWIMEKIAYFKENGLDRNKLYSLEGNVLLYLTPCYLSHFAEFQTTVDDVAPVIQTCEFLLKAENPLMSKQIAEPYVRYVESIQEEYLEGHFCVQGKNEFYLLWTDHEEMRGFNPTKDNYTYLFVMYCRILDCILYSTEQEYNYAQSEKRRLLNIARTISPCNATVWEALSRVSNSEEEYSEYISLALKYSLRPGEPYGIGAVYRNLATHYLQKDLELFEALYEFTEKYNGDTTMLIYILSKINQEPRERIPLNEAENILKAAGIQVGLSELAKRALVISENISTS